MILVADRLGQLGNRLFQFAHLIAFAAEHRVRVANPGFRDYASDFESFADDALCRWPPPRRPLSPRWTEASQRQTARILALVRRPRALRGPIGLLDSDEQAVDLSEPPIARRARRGLMLATGWNLRDEAAFERHAEVVRSTFRPVHERAAAAAAAVSAARGGADVLVGLHMRRGDYARYAGGRYLWDASAYAALAERARALQPGRRVAVLACGDDPEALAQLSDVAALGPGHLVEDLHALAGCDLIVGPPSTFSAWAAFYGRVPLRHLEAPDSPLALADFREPA